MKMAGNTVLITGGGSGIGLAFAERFLEKGNSVIIVGRREEKLQEAKEKFPELHTKVCDLSKQEERISLFEWVSSHFPDVNVLVNNAGIQQRVNVLKATESWDYYSKEIHINVEGLIHLSLLFIPYFLTRTDASIINISSGLAIRPGAWVPIYSATKSAVHSFTASLRLQLENTHISVVEVFPPAVNTDLGGAGLHTFGAPLDSFADSIFERFEKGDLEIGYEDSEKRLHASREENEEGMKKAWEGFLKGNPDF